MPLLFTTHPRPAKSPTEESREQSRREASRITEYLAHSLPLPLILLLAALLRFYQLSNQSLWADEGNSVALARRDFAEIARRTAFDIHPPLYYWLLKVWTAIFGDNEAGLRSLSVVLGIGLVYLIWVLGKRLFSPRVGLIATLIAAFSPLQVYYSQETRMYTLLAFLSALTVLLAFLMGPRPNNTLVKVAYVLTVTAGLYTHYAYPIILIVVNLAAIIRFIQNSKLKTQNSKLLNWLILQLIPLLLYLPWLPIAWRQITTWPSERQIDSLAVVLGTISTTLLFGLSWPYNLGLTAAVGLALTLVASYWFGFRNRRSRFTNNIRPALVLLWLWFLLPVLLTIFIFSPAFLKFLLVAAPPLAILLAFVIAHLTTIFNRRWLGYLVGGAILAAVSGASTLSLYHYYTNSTFARDNYRGIVQFIKAVGGPEDAIILNAEGQQDVFNYYYERGLALEAPVHPLPRRRPLAERDTLIELQGIADQADKVYAVYWATYQADPDGLIEGWLNAHLFKAADQWYGNVRLVSYASPQAGAKLAAVPVNYQLGPNIGLTSYALSTLRIAPGDILQVVLQWQTNAPLMEDYVVFLQVLDQNNHLVGQRDAEPLIPTSNWQAGKQALDAYGIFIEPGTPPGKHRLIVGMYNGQTGERLPVDNGGDFVELVQIEVVRPFVSLPLDAFNIQVPMNESILGVDWLGYDFYKLGQRSSPDTPLHVGDPVQLVAYWTLRRPGPQVKDRVSIRVVKNEEEETPVAVTYPLAGVDYPVSEWQAGEIIRAQYDFFLSNLGPGTYRLVLAVSTTTEAAQVVTRPFRVESLPPR